jgi:hypothetical protein
VVILKKYHSVFLVVALLPFAFVTASAQTHSPDKLRVLFIGNSLTYVNDLPAIVGALAKQTKHKKFDYKTVAFPDFSLEDHWAQGEARKAIAKGGWDIVVLQQGPSALPESRVLLREYVRKFGEEIKRAGAKPALYMVWPSTERSRDFDRVIESYRLAAEDVDGLLLSAGAAWQAALKRTPALELYASDGFHPAPLGSFLAAWVIFKKFYDDSFEMPARLTIDSDKLKRIELTPSQLETLRLATLQ